MSDLKVHVNYSSERPKSHAYAKIFIDAFGQTPIEEAEYIFSAGGDGTLFHSLHMSMESRMQPVITGTALDSASKGYLTDHGVHSPDDLFERIDDDLTDMIDAGIFVNVVPLRVDAFFENENRKTLFIFNDVSAVRATNQSAHMRIVRSFNDKSQTTKPLHGDGIIISTAMGSTGLNDSHGGPILKVGDNRIILNDMAGDKTSDWESSIEEHDTVIHVHFKHAAKETERPVRIDYDRGHFQVDEEGDGISRVVSLRAEASSKHSVPLCVPRVKHPLRLERGG